MMENENNLLFSNEILIRIRVRIFTTSLQSNLAALEAPFKFGTPWNNLHTSNPVQHPGIYAAIHEVRLVAKESRF